MSKNSSTAKEVPLVSSATSMSHLDESGVQKAPLLSASEEELDTRMLRYLTALASIGGLLFGYDTGIISGALVMLDSDFVMSVYDEELIVSLTVAGALISSIMAGPLGDEYGRRPVVLGSSIAFITGSLTMALAQSLDMLFVGRFVVGLGVGSASMIVPIYLAECAPMAYRGRIVVVCNVALCFGQVLACVIAGIFSGSAEGWRWMLGLAALPAAVQLAGFMFLVRRWGVHASDRPRISTVDQEVPESPRFLLCSGDVRGAQQALQLLRETGAEEVIPELDALREDMQQEQRAMLAELRGEESEGERYLSNSNTRVEVEVDVDVIRGGGFKGDGGVDINASHCHSQPVMPKGFQASDAGSSSSSSSSSSPTPAPDMWRLLRKKSTSRALLLGCALQAAQQFGGINTVMYYGATIFTLAGASRSTSIWLSIGLALCNFLGSCVAFSLTDRIGRRLPTIISCIGMSCSLALIAAAFHFTEAERASAEDNEGNRNGNGVSSALWIIFSCVCLYLLCYAPGMGSTPWTVCSEIFPTAVRGYAASITTTMNWTGNLLMSMTFLTITRNFGTSGAFLTYAAIMVLFSMFFVFYLPETRGVPMERISDLFSDKSWGKAARTTTKR